MIDSLRARVEWVGEGQARLAVGPVTLVALVSPLTAMELEARAGREVTVYTAIYLQGHGMGSLEPVLLAFASAHERAFYRLLTEVEGMGPRAALRALAAPVAAIAQAIVRGDAAWLQRLPGVGRQRAADLIARLREKVERFAVAEDGAGAGAGGAAPAGTGPQGRGPAVADEVRADVLAVLAQLGYGAREAERLLARAAARRPDARAAEELLREALRAARAAATAEADAMAGAAPGLGDAATVPDEPLPAGSAGGGEGAARRRRRGGGSA